MPPKNKLFVLCSVFFKYQISNPLTPDHSIITILFSGQAINQAQELPDLNGTQCISAGDSIALQLLPVMQMVASLHIIFQL